MNGRHVMQSCDTSLGNHRFKAYSFSFFIHEWQPCTNQNSWCVWDNTCTQHNHQGLLKKPQTNLLHDGGYDMFLCILAVELFKKVTNLVHFFSGHFCHWAAGENNTWSRFTKLEIKRQGLKLKLMIKVCWKIQSFLSFQKKHFGQISFSFCLTEVRVFLNWVQRPYFWSRSTCIEG